ncbi:MAG: hypothetical protein HC831_04000 [Chloroflexia bacterium]|nr:hypothetical protein [Chloroflexia bacterium]
MGGNDNYFNNGIYIKGWTYNEMLLGNPLITSPVILQGNRYDYIRNNKIIAHHLGIEGNIQQVQYKLLYTYSLNYGTNEFQISPVKAHHTTLITIKIPDKFPWNLSLSCSLGADFGNLYGKNLGAMVSIRKQIF